MGMAYTAYSRHCSNPLVRGLVQTICGKISVIKPGFYIAKALEAIFLSSYYLRGRGGGGGG